MSFFSEPGLKTFTYKTKAHKKDNFPPQSQSCAMAMRYLVMGSTVAGKGKTAVPIGNGDGQTKKQELLERRDKAFFLYS